MRKRNNVHHLKFAFHNGSRAYDAQMKIVPTGTRAAGVILRTIFQVPSGRLEKHDEPMVDRSKTEIEEAVQRTKLELQYTWGTRARAPNLDTLMKMR